MQAAAHMKDLMSKAAGYYVLKRVISCMGSCDDAEPSKGLSTGAPVLAPAFTHFCSVLSETITCVIR